MWVTRTKFLLHINDSDYVAFTAMQPDATPDSNCCTANAGPNCDFGPCEDTVCLGMPECCDTLWVQACADAAFTMCGSLCAEPAIYLVKDAGAVAMPSRGRR